MQKKTQAEQGSHAGSKVAAGLGLAALAAATAGALFLYGTDSGKKRRKQMESWMLRMKADVIDRMAKMKDWSEGSYNELIDTVGARYKGIKNIDTTEVAALVTDLKKHWRNLKKQAEAGSKSTTPKKRSSKSKSKPSDASPASAA